MTGHEIRRSFLEFFAQRGHRVVRSSSLVPHGDPTLLFTNAGMNQFKDVFLGLEQRDFRRAATAQKCVRAGGKHNDLENVGRTLRHHTFFEMLGNFSFGDYFKREAIAYAWELVTRTWRMPREKLYATVFGETEVVPGQKIPTDKDSHQFWLEVGVPANRVFEITGFDNFWAMGDTGPCGPCSEIFYDFGPAASDLGHTDCRFPCDCGRYVEIWNLVFIQYNRDASGKLAPLPKPGVDTGAGLERLAAALQGRISNYDTDLFRPLIARAAEMAGRNYGEDHRTDVALRIIADHSRAAAFLIADGVLPSNEGRGYVLRKILRRAIDHGRRLGLERPFLYEMAGQVAELMRAPYPEVLESIQRVATVIKGEEEIYARLVLPAIAGVRKYMEARGWIPKEPREREFSLSKAQAGELLFYAYSTLGLRPDFMQDWLQAQRCELPRDFNEPFEDRLEEERERAKASWKGVGKEAASPAYRQLAGKLRPEFIGYTKLEGECRITGIVSRDGLVNELAAGAEGEVVLDPTPFYAEAGGQVGDSGLLLAPDSDEEVARVRTTYYPLASLPALKVTAKERLRVGDRVRAVVDAEARAATMRNHTGTHLLHAALRAVLGPHVKQSGSLVAPDRLRFDFSHYAPLDPEELAEIERLANEHILRDTAVTEERMDLDAALKSGALAFFGDKYPEKNVRVITIGEFSKELCGGTHVRHTGQIGLLKLTSESSIAAGIRRVEAITGATALERFQQAIDRLQQAAALLKTTDHEVVESLERLLEERRAGEKQLEALRHRLAQQQVEELVQRVRRVKDVPVLVAQLEAVDRTTLRSLVDSLRQKLGSAVIVLGTSTNGKVALIAAVTKDLTPKLHAGKIAQQVAGRMGGTGGGRADLAEAGGKDAGQLGQALADVYAIVEKML